MEKMTLKNLAYHTIKNNIINCSYAPGGFLSEENLSMELKISRTPIRDALGRLEQEGLIEIKPKVGIIVVPLTLKDVTMCFEIRMLYEPHTLKHYGADINSEKLAEFHRIFSHPELLHDTSINQKEYYRLDTEFHQLILDSSPNHYMKRSYHRIQAHIERFRYLTGTITVGRLEDTFREHCKIIEACLKKDWNLAADQMYEHLKVSKQSAFQLAFNNMVNTKDQEKR